LIGSGHGLILKYYPSTHLEGLRKTTKNLNQDSQLPRLRPESGTSQIQSRCVNHLKMTFGDRMGKRKFTKHNMKLQNYRMQINRKSKDTIERGFFKDVTDIKKSMKTKR
jgi:hypothetical protein